MDAVPEEIELETPSAALKLSFGTAGLPAIIAIMIIGYLDGVTGQDIGLSFLYLGPVVLLGWTGRNAGLLGATLATAAWFASELLFWKHHTALGAALNGGFRFLSFALIAMASTRIRHGRERQRALNARLSLLLNHADRLAVTGKLASGVAHELGTPLNVIIGRSKLITSGELSPAELTDSARIIGEQAARMASVVRQLLDFTRRGETLKTVQDLRAVARRSTELLSKLAERARVVTILDLPPQGVEARFDATQLEQVLVNVMVNAIQAMPGGGRVFVTVAHEDGHPPDGTTGAFPCITVRDEGTGIAPDDLPHIFEPFFTTKDVGEGTGLGLAVAHGIILDHGGWFEVASPPGQGTTFRVFLPRPGSARP